MPHNAWAFRNARLWLDGHVYDGDLLVTDNRIAGIGSFRTPRGTRDRDLNGQVIAPGLIDLQLNGLEGAEALRPGPKSLRRMSQAAVRFGCTAFLPTLISSPRSVYRDVFRNVPVAPEAAGARILGFHMEGPYISPEFPGAHTPASLRPPDCAEAAEILEQSNGKVLLWTLAPELDGADDLIAMLVERKVRVAAGHSGLAFDDAMGWFDRGVTLVTHLFNAMTPLHHRLPGLPGAAVIHPGVHVSLIADGYHVHPAMVEVARTLCGPRLVLITDAASPAGCPPGRYSVSGREVIYDGELPRLTDGTLAGSGLTAWNAVTNLARFTPCSPVEAAVHMSAAPARVLGLQDLGRLGEGMLADFLILRPDGELAETWVDGRLAYGGMCTE